MKFLPLIVRNLLRNKRRNLLTIFSIAVSLFVFSALVSLPDVVDQMTLSGSTGRLVCINKAGFFYPLPIAYKQKIQAIPHVVAVGAETYFGGIYHDASDQFANSAVDFEDVETIFPDWGLSDSAVREFKRQRTACMVGTALMKRFNWHIGQQIILRGTIYPVNVSLKIVGTLGRKFPTFMFFRRDYLDEILPEGESGWATDFWIKLDDPRSAPSVIAQIDETFANSSYETRTESEQSFMDSFISTLGPIFTLTKVLAFIVLVALSLVAVNTAAMSIRERHTELAVMRSIGFSPRLVTSLLLGESTLIGLVGGIIGSGVAYALLASGGFGAEALMQVGVIQMAPRVLIESVVIGGLIGTLSAAVPAGTTIRRNIAEVLRAVG